MDRSMPQAVTLVEVGPRDGFQFETRVVPTERKLAVIARLAAAGLKAIQVASFVNPARVPQMADAERLVRGLPADDGVAYSALVLNRRGLDRAMACGVRTVEISLSASDTHSRKNTGMDRDEALRQGLAMIDRAVRAGLHVRAGVQCVFGCVYEGRMDAARTADIVCRFADHGAHSLSLADTTGMASPPTIRETLETVLPLAGRLPMALHLHDTRGLGLVNLNAALQLGIATFDTALAGMGGCPFVAGAAGNIATEDTVHFLDTLGIRTGVDHRRVGAVSRDLETFFQKAFPGRLHRLTAPGTPPTPA